MSKDNEKDYEVGYGKPPKSGQFKKGQSGNPSGRPKSNDKQYRLSKQGMREMIMNAAYSTVEVVTKGEKKTVPRIYAIIAQQFNKAVKGDTKAAKMALDLMKAAASENDEILYEWTLSWIDMQNDKLRASANPGSLEHFNAVYKYFMFKKDIRRVEGVETWPYEDEEPITDEDWHYFLDQHDYLERRPNETVAWPLKYPSHDPDNF